MTTPAEVVAEATSVYAKAKAAVVKYGLAVAAFVVGVVLGHVL